jgi:hypothetical protein
VRNSTASLLPWQPKAFACQACRYPRLCRLRSSCRSAAEASRLSTRNIFAITRQEPPADSLLKAYRGGPHPERWGRYGDCFSVSVERTVSLAEFVYGFYTSPVFRLERGLLRFAGAGATNADARAVAEGRSAAFAVWYVAQRTADQLLMVDRYQRTRSWFRVVPNAGGGTLLQFGSAVAAAARDAGSGRRSPVFRLLLIFHVAYSQLLLRSAERRMTRLARAQ